MAIRYSIPYAKDSNKNVAVILSAYLRHSMFKKVYTSSN